jgi:hypothetical protein
MHHSNYTPYGLINKVVYDTDMFSKAPKYNFDFFF